MKKKSAPAKAEELRRKAEKRLEPLLADPQEISPAEAPRLIQELQTYQIELEMQNEELRQAQAGLEESRSRYADLYDFAPIGYLTLDADGTIVEANLTAARQLGMDRRRLLHRQFPAFISPPDKEVFRLHLNKVFRDQTRQTCEIPLKGENGIEFYALLDSIFVQDADGQNLCRTSLTDITRLKQAEGELKGYRDHLEKLVEERTAELTRVHEKLRQEIAERRRADEEAVRLATFPQLNPNPVLEVDVSGNITFYNAATLKTLKKLGLPDEVKLFLPQDLGEILKAAKEQGKRQFYREVEINGAVFAERIHFAKQFQVARLYATDITERKRANREVERLASFPQLNPNPILEVDISGNITFYNNASLQTLQKLGLPSEVKVFLPQDLGEILKAAKELGTRQFYREVEINGTVFAERIHFAKQFQVARLYATDITERKQAEKAQRLNEARQTALLKLHRMADAPLQEITRSVVEDCVMLTESHLGFVGFINEDETILQAHLWSERAMAQCAVDGKPAHFPIDQGGVWAETVRQRRPIMANDYAAANPYKKGFPEGHVALSRFLGVPIMEGKRVVAVAGVANKEHDYNDSDIHQLALLLEGMWDIVRQKRAAEELQKAHDELEHRVQERTADLRLANEQLLWEIEERQQIEAKLRDSEARFRTLFQTAGSVILSISAEGRFLEFNQEAERLTGWTRQEVLGQDIFKLLATKETREVAETLMAKVLTGEIIRAVEVPIKMRDGTERLFLWNSNLVPGPGGQPAEVLAVGQDITQRKQTEAALEAERQRLFSLLEELPANVYLLAPDHSMSFVNRYFRERFGDPGGRPCYEVLHGLTNPCGECPAIAVLEEKTPREWEWTSPDGRTYQIYDYPFADVDGSPLVLELGIDITARKQAEEALREQSRILEAFFEHTITPLVFLDRDFHYIRVNEAYAQACQREVSEFPGRNLFSFFPSAEVEGIFAEVVKTRVPFLDMARPFAFPDHPEWGVTYWDWTLVPIVDNTGEVEFLVFFLKDVTERQQALAALEESEHKLRFLTSQLLTAQERERSRLSRELHDELGQSLMVLKLQMRNLEKKLGEGRQAFKENFDLTLQYLNEVIDNVRRLYQDLSPSILEDLGLSAALKNLFHEFCKHYGIREFLVDLDEVDDLFSQECQINIYRIFQESLTNIGKHAHPTSVALSVKREAGRVSLVVEDNGVGFDLEDILAREPRAKGMGLAAMDERVRILGGSLEIRSSKGAGAKITVIVPVDEKADR